MSSSVGVDGAVVAATERSTRARRSAFMSVLATNSIYLRTRLSSLAAVAARTQGILVRILSAVRSKGEQQRRGAALTPLPRTRLARS
jgi:hypothetical protein